MTLEYDGVTLALDGEPVDTVTPAGSRLLACRVASATEGDRALNIGDGLFGFVRWTDARDLARELVVTIRGMQ